VKRKVKNKEFLDALKKHYEAEVEKNKVTLKLYLDEPLAVSDHENLLDSMKFISSRKLKQHGKKRIKAPLCWSTRT